MTYLPDKEYRELKLGSVDLQYSPSRGQTSAKVSVEYTNRKGDVQPLVLRIQDISLEALRCIAQSIWEVIWDVEEDSKKTKDVMKGKFE